MPPPCAAPQTALGARSTSSSPTTRSTRPWCASSRRASTPRKGTPWGWRPCRRATRSPRSWSGSCEARNSDAKESRLMKIDGGLSFDLSKAAAAAAQAEADGYDGVWSAETSHDPFLPIAAAAGATTSLDYGTGITVAFARNPMTLAVVANDLQLLTKGRFLLGMGSQIKPHITKRFSMPWSHPAPRMRA